MLYRRRMAKYSADQKTSILAGRVLRNPMTIGFIGSFFMADEKGRKFFIAPSRAFSQEVVRHLVEGDIVEIATISTIKPEVMLYAHELRFRNYDFTTNPPMY